MLVRHRSLSIVAAALAVALLAGCSSQVKASEPEASNPQAQQVPLSELSILESPKGYQGPSTAMLGTASVEAITDSPAQSLPVTLTSHDLSGDTPVTVRDTSRVLGLDMSGSIAATIVGLGFGDSLVGRDVSSTFPEVADLPLVTSSGHSINNESIIALRPTLIVTDGSIGPIDVVLQLRDAGIPVVFIDKDAGFDSTATMARQVAAAFGAPETGELLASKLAADIEAKTAEIAQIVPQNEGDKLRMLFLYLRGSSGIYYLFGEESGTDDLVNALGGIDVATEIGWAGMKPMTDEAIIAARPDLILVMTSGLESVGGVDSLLDTKLAIAQTPAGQNRRFVDMADGQILSFGPRTADVLDALARAIYAPEG